MLILLPPSETKSDGGTGGPLDLDSLALPELTPARETVIDAVVALADDPDAPRILGLGATQSADAARNGDLHTGPTAPALERYTGVLYDAFDAKSLTRAGRARAAQRLWIGSALFGAVRATDLVPWYRPAAPPCRASAHSARTGSRTSVTRSPPPRRGWSSTCGPAPIRTSGPCPEP